MITPIYVLAIPMSEKKKNIPEAIITNGTIIGDISSAIIGRRNGISLRDKPIAASVPKPVASSVANIPIIKLTQVFVSLLMKRLNYHLVNLLFWVMTICIFALGGTPVLLMN